MLKLKLQYFGHLMQRADSFEKTLMLGKIEGRKRRGQQRIRWLGWHHQINGHGFGWIPRVGDGQGGLACCGSWGCKESNTTELNWTEGYFREILKLTCKAFTCISNIHICHLLFLYIQIRQFPNTTASFYSFHLSIHSLIHQFIKHIYTDTHTYTHTYIHTFTHTVGEKASINKYYEQK